MFVAVGDALNVIFELPLRRGIENWFRRRLLSFGIVLIAGSLLVLALAVQAVTGLVESLLGDGQPGLQRVADAVGIAVSAVLGTLVLTVLLRLLTFSTVPWRYALVGSVITALGLAVGAWGIGVVFALLFFIYLEAQILLAGAELTNVMWRRGMLDFGTDPG